MLFISYMMLICSTCSRFQKLSYDKRLWRHVVMMDQHRINYPDVVTAIRSINNVTHTVMITEPIDSIQFEPHISESFNIVLRDTLSQNFLQLSVLELYSVQFNFPLVITINSILIDFIFVNIDSKLSYIN